MKKLKLTKGQYAIVDDDDYKWLSKFNWQYANAGYAKRTRFGILMHREIMRDIPHDLVVDHINGNKLDNRKSNLRVVTPADNARNKHHSVANSSSRYIGVAKCKQTGRWEARIKVCGKQIWLGRHKSELQAAQVRDAYIREAGIIAAINLQ